MRALCVAWALVVEVADLRVTQVHVELSGQHGLAVSWASNAEAAFELVLLAGGAEQQVQPTQTRYSFRCAGDAARFYSYAPIGKVGCEEFPRQRGKPGIPLADYTSPWLYHANFTTEPGATYTYTIAHGGRPLAGPHTLKAPPPAGLGQALKIAIVSDIGQTAPSALNCERIAREQPDLAILPGDLAYADGDQRRWDSYAAMMQRCSTTVPWLLTVGNHEVEPGLTLENEPLELFTSVRSRYLTPEVQPAVVSPRMGATPPYNRFNWTLGYDYGGSFYSYEVGPVHFIMLNPYTADSVHAADSPQLRWLAQDLQAVDRARTPLVFVVVHCPFYHTNVAHRTEEEMPSYRLKAAAEPLFERYGPVTAVFAGHVHAYQRFGPHLHDQPGRGPIHVLLGNGGNHEGVYDEWAVTGTAGLTAEAHSTEHGFTLLHVNADGRGFGVTAVNAKDGAVADSAAFELRDDLQVAEVADSALGVGGSVLLGACGVATLVLLGWYLARK